MRLYKSKSDSTWQQLQMAMPHAQLVVTRMGCLVKSSCAVAFTIYWSAAARDVVMPVHIIYASVYLSAVLMCISNR